MTQIVSEPKIQMPQEPLKPQIPSKPVMTADVAAYPKLYKIYKELNRQNEINFNEEKECNSLEGKRDNLKEFAKLTKKGEIQSEIDKVNERIDLLKAGLSGIVKRYGYQNVQDFYRVYRTARTAYMVYREKETEWKERNCMVANQETFGERIQKHKKEAEDRQARQIHKNKDRGGR